MTRFSFLCTLLLILFVCFKEGSTFNVASSITVSGLSSGAFFAVQYHVSQSSVVSGAAIIAGGPYYCAEADAGIAVTACMTSPSEIDVSVLVKDTAFAEDLGSIDKTSNLASTRLYLFSGSKDTVVAPGVMQAAQKYYENYIDSSNIQAVFDIPAQHAMITNDYGEACDFKGTPYINNCNLSLAGELFQWLYPSINFNAPVDAVTSNFLTFNQSTFTPYNESPSTFSLYESGYVYVPTSCQDGSVQCQLHIAFHGCLQCIAKTGSQFYTDAGYNQWAESNNIIVVYPQTDLSDLNPECCWDWWGYTGLDYATNLGPQIITVKNIVNWIPRASMSDSL